MKLSQQAEKMQILRPVDSSLNATLSWKFHQNPPICYFVMFLWDGYSHPILSKFLDIAADQNTFKI